MTEENKNAPEEGGKNLQRRTKRRTSTYKHVNIDRQRPKLTREGEGASTKEGAPAPKKKVPASARRGSKSPSGGPV